MASEYTPKEMTGSLWRNERKTADKQPDYTGSCLIAGHLYRIAGWVREAQGSGKKYFSFAFSVPQSQGVPADRKPEPPPPPPAEDIPF